MPLFSNIDEVGGWLDDVVADFGFESPAPGGDDLGTACAGAVVGGIQDRSLQQQRGATKDWPKNDRRYHERKVRKYHSHEVNYRTRQMLSTESLIGQTTVTPDVVTMKYGTGSPASDSPSGYLSKWDMITTDITKAEKAHEQDRNFYELSDETNQPVLEIVGQALATYLQDRANR